jgi:hypothetical protein
MQKSSNIGPNSQHNPFVFSASVIDYARAYIGGSAMWLYVGYGTLYGK